MSEWQPIETAPKDGRPILICDTMGFHSIAEWRERRHKWIAMAEGETVYKYEEAFEVCPTHWMPLPEPPK